MERFIAVDNVCAWPNLTTMPDGALAATIFNQPVHGAWEGDVECWASEDGGRLWGLRGVPAPHDPGENRMNVAAGLARDKALIVIASGWSHRPPKGQPRKFKEAHVLSPWVCRSVDGGREWEVGKTDVVEPAGDGPPAIIPFGDIVELADGRLGVSFYGQLPEGGNRAYLYVSADDGRTWSRRSVIHAVDGNETDLLVLADGRVLAAARTLKEGRLDLFASEDNGCTWTCLGRVTRGRQHPAHLLALADGQVLLTYGLRNKGMFGVGVQTSSDRGETWSAPRVLVNSDNATDGGYPSSAQLEDGTIVTAYYLNRNPWHHRYHMGVVRWALDD